MKSCCLFICMIFIAFGLCAQPVNKELARKRNFEIGIGAGMDYIIFPNYNLHFNAYVLNTPSLRLAVRNQAAVCMPMFIFMQTYYPSIQLQNKYKSLWYTVAAGPEYIRVSRSEGRGPHIFRVDRRFDAGIRWEESERFYYAFSVPIRVDREIPWFLTGFNFTSGFRF